MTLGTLVQDVFAFNDVARDERAAWIDRRNWRYAGHPIDLSEILVFRDEAMLLELLGGMDDLDRRAWRAVLTRWPMRGGREDERIAAAQEWLRRMGLDMAALTPDEELLLRRFRQLPQEKRSEFNEHMGDQFRRPLPSRSATARSCPIHPIQSHRHRHRDPCRCRRQRRYGRAGLKEKLEQEWQEIPAPIIIPEAEWLERIRRRTPVLVMVNGSTLQDETRLASKATDKPDASSRDILHRFEVDPKDPRTVHRRQRHAAARIAPLMDAR